MIYSFNAEEVFKIAVDIEENGLSFYQKAAAKTDEPEVKAVLEDLGREEVKHKQRFLELKDQLPEKTTGSTVWDPQNEIDQYLKMMADGHVFAKSENVGARLADVKGAVDALNLAIQFEKDSIVFFLEMQGLAENEEGRREIGRLVKEEQGHLKKLTLQLRKLTC